jgi:hypothetical protein
MPNKAIKNRRKRRGWTREQRSPFIAALAASMAMEHYVYPE